MSKLLFIILIIAFLVRVIGIDYGLPNEFISDEFLMVAVSLKMLDAGSLRPYFGDIFYHQPLSAYISIAGITPYLGLKLLSGKFGSIQEMTAYYSENNAANARELLIVTRFLAVLFGTATVYLLYLVGRDLFGARVGLVAAFFGTFEFLLVEINHTGRVWSFLVFFVTLALLASVRVFKRGNTKDYILSALSSSLALATLLPGVMTFFSSWAMKFSLKNKKLWTAFLILFLFAIISIFLNPRGLGVVLLRFDINLPFLSDFVLDSSNVASGTIGSSRTGWFDKFTDPFVTLFNYTPIYFTLFFAGLAILWKEDRKKFLILSSFPSAYYLFIAPLFSYGDIERALTPFVPYVVLGSAFATDRIFEKIKRKDLILFLVFAFSFYSIFLSSLFDVRMLRSDTREQAIEWLEKNIPSDKRAAHYTRYVWGNESADQFNDAEKKFESKELVAKFDPAKRGRNLKNNFFNNIQNPAQVLLSVERFGPAIEIYKVKKAQPAD